MKGISKSYNTKKPFDQYVIEYELYLSNPEKYPMGDKCLEVITRSLEVAGYLVQYRFDNAETIRHIKRKYPGMSHPAAKLELERAKEVWAVDGEIKKKFEERRIRRALWIQYEQNESKNPKVAVSALKLLIDMLPPDPVEAPDVTPIFSFPRIVVADPKLLDLSEEEICEIDRKSLKLKQDWIEKNSHVIESE